MYVYICVCVCVCYLYMYVCVYLCLHVCMFNLVYIYRPIKNKINVSLSHFLIFFIKHDSNGRWQYKDTVVLLLIIINLKMARKYRLQRAHLK